MAASARSSPPPSSRNRQPSRPLTALLPHGPCNFRDLAQGRDTRTCGCRRFWLDDAPRSPQNQAWCCCGHHACFHDQVEREVVMAGTEEEVDSARFMTPTHHLPRPATALRSASERKPRRSFKRDLRHRTSESPAASYVSDSNRTPTPGTQTRNSLLGLGLALHDPRPAHPPSASASARTLFNLHAFSDHGLPSTQAPSAPQSVQGQESRPSQTRSFAGPPLDVGTLPPPPPNENQSATEIATPSLSGTPRMHNNEHTSSVRRPSEAIAEARPGVPPTCSEATTAQSDVKPNLTDRSSARSESLLATVPDLGSLSYQLDQVRGSILETFTAIQSLTMRMSAVENVSFGHASIDGLGEQFELFDGRMTEMEDKVGELEKFRGLHEDNLNDLDSRRRRRGQRLDDPTAQSFDSHASALSGHSIEMLEALKEEAVERLQDLESRLATLEKSSGPTPDKPWSLEVVLIPWGRELKGLWALAEDASQPSCSNGSEATQSHEALYTPDHAMEDWQGSGDWLVPRACSATSGTRGRIFERLQSRGFVQTVELCHNDARDIQQTIRRAFDNIISPAKRSDLVSPSLLGLSSHFIPLRKVHRSSQLHFLSRAELATPATWSIDFLESTVVMKQPTKGRRMLFVTTSDAYMQDSSGLTWQKLREMPRYEFKTGLSSAVGEANAREECWVPDPKLDPPEAVSAHSSFASLHNSFASSHPLSPGDSQAGSLGDSESEAFDFGSESSEHQQVRLSSSPRRRRSNGPAPITPVSEYPVPLSGLLAEAMPPAMRRTTSLPSAMSMSQTGNLAVNVKRQVASFDASGHVPTSPPKVMTKRRRTSRTPEHQYYAGAGPRDLTPRRSREPPSPGAMQMPGDDSYPHHVGGDSAAPSVYGGNSRDDRRGITPQAYATPYSNSVPAYISLGPEDEGGDTDMDSDSDESESDSEDEGFREDARLSAEFDRAVQRDEEVWEGVGDGGEINEEDDESEVDGDELI